MNRASSRRAALIAVLLAIVTAAIADLLRSDSAIERFLRGAPTDPRREYLDELRERGVPVPDRVGSSASAHPQPDHA